MPEDKSSSDLAQTDASIDQVTDETGTAMGDGVNAMLARVTLLD